MFAVLIASFSRLEQHAHGLAFQNSWFGSMCGLSLCVCHSQSITFMGSHFRIRGSDLSADCLSTCVTVKAASLWARIVYHIQSSMLMGFAFQNWRVGSICRVSLYVCHGQSSMLMGSHYIIRRLALCADCLTSCDTVRAACSWARISKIRGLDLCADCLSACVTVRAAWPWARILVFVACLFAMAFDALRVDRVHTVQIR